MTKQNFDEQLLEILADCNEYDYKIHGNSFKFSKAIAQIKALIASQMPEERKQEHFGFMEGKDIEEMYELADKEDTQLIALIEGFNQALQQTKERLGISKASPDGREEK